MAGAEQPGLRREWQLLQLRLHRDGHPGSRSRHAHHLPGDHVPHRQYSHGGQPGGAQRKQRDAKPPELRPVQGADDRNSPQPRRCQRVRLSLSGRGGSERQPAVAEDHAEFRRRKHGAPGPGDLDAVVPRLVQRRPHAAVKIGRPRRLRDGSRGQSKITGESCHHCEFAKL